MTAPRGSGDGEAAPTPRELLLLPFFLILITAILTPAGEFHTNQSDVGLYLDKARSLVSGLLPYRDFKLEYPPLALIPMVVPYLLWPFGDVVVEDYRWLFAGWEAVLMLALGFVLVRIVRLAGDADAPLLLPRGDAAASADLRHRLRVMAVRLLVLAIGAALALTWRYDVFPALLVMLAVWAALDGRPGLAGFLIGLGILAKLYPLVVLPALAIPWLFPLQVPRLARFGAAAALTVVLGTLPFLLLGGNDPLPFLTYQVQRGLQIESVGGGLAVLGGLLAGQPVKVSFGFSAVQVEGPFAAAWLSVLPVLTIAMLGLLGWLGWRRVTEERATYGAVTTRTIVALTATSILILLMTSKVLSIQYVVWILPFAALMPRWRYRLAAVLIALTMPIHPVLYRELVAQQALPILVLNARNAVLVALTGWMLWSVARSAGLEPTTFRSTT